MRIGGYDKTPDVKLDVPFATKDGAIVNWIESKALFGDDENHEGYLQDQLRCYWNRLGTGLVIYWFGFISDLRISALKEGILIEEAFPSDDQIILMNPVHDIHDEIPSYEEGHLENPDKNGLGDVSDFSVEKVKELNNPLERNNSDELTIEISNITQSIECATIE